MEKILTLDGGGSWALIQVRALINLYSRDTRGHDILSKFDLVAATSGGALVLAGLARNFTLGRIEELFLDKKQRKTIFDELPLGDLKKALGFGVRYSTKGKRKGLRQIFGDGEDTRLSTIRDTIQTSHGHAPEFLITSFEYDRRRAYLFRSQKNSKSSSNSGTTTPPLLADALHATTNAPVNYFDEPAKIDSYRYWDGGVSGNNNPVLVAVTEWLANQPAGSTETPAVLSIGTGNVFLPRPEDGHDAEDKSLLLDRSSSNLVEDIQVMATSILDDPPDTASYIAHVMLRQPLSQDVNAPVVTGAVVRMNPLVQPVLDEGATGKIWRVPDLRGAADKKANLRRFKDLKDLDMDAVEDDDVEKIADFADAWLADRVPNQPIRAGRDLRPQIGHARYSSAKASWTSLA